ncbi:MAG: 2,3-bisphosphoglycerate-independent phosphoglycerate mutase [Candidatus Pacebacteria bacterium]|nr:2,3-bisphosphoglycerate-independent phosphoglycerate mutase [Candidatus Paceibacterota bacterium]MDD5721859.1 2,3-bisphosphoglycerate-independent phosphoglycerate mutase [Candidatus Paceibacterota bacterium]
MRYTNGNNFKFMPRLCSKICLIILDGWGIGEKNFTNAIYRAGTPNLDKIKKYYPMLSLQASGIAVGLPFNRAGNSEVGHLTLGSGQIIYQYSVRISQSIENGSFFQNPALLEVANHVKENDSTLHLAGLLSENIVHSAYNHLLALLDLANSLKISKVNLHLFTDGRDSPPKRALDLVAQLMKDMKKKNVGRIASIAGRFYAMDRDQNFSRIAKSYDILTEGKGKIIKDPLVYLKESYQEGITDEFIVPAIIEEDQNPDSLGFIKENDGIIFFNFREERMRQLVEAFSMPEFKEFPVKNIPGLKIATFTEYKKEFPVKVAFPPQKVTACLSQILSQYGKRQFHLAETEKYAHVTYFFNCLKEKPFPGEYWVIIPSIKTLRLEDYPALKSLEISTRLIQAFEENIYEFILVNYASPDLIGHTGNIKSGIECAKIIDQEVGKIIKKSLDLQYTTIITADHGNLERMMNPITGEIETEHDASLVPFYLIDSRWKLSAPRTEKEIAEIERWAGGMLADVAPTILELFGLPIPPEMTGQSLLPLLNIKK